MKNEDKLEFSKVLEAIKVCLSVFCRYSVSIFSNYLFTNRLSNLPGKLQRQIRWGQEEVGRWCHGLQVAGENQGQGKADRKGGCPASDLSVALLNRIYCSSLSSVQAYCGCLDLALKVIFVCWDILEKNSVRMEYFCLIPVSNHDEGVSSRCIEISNAHSEFLSSTIILWVKSVS